MGKRTTQTDVAVKVPLVPNGDGKMSDEMTRDLAVNWNLPHQNILKVFGVCQLSAFSFDSSSSCGSIEAVVYELMDLDLAKLLKQSPEGRLLTKLLVQVLRGVSAGLAHLHKNKVLHGNVKLANVLLRGPQYDDVKLCDLGWSEDLNESDRKMGNLGTTASEVLQEPLVADVRSFGELRVRSSGCL